MKGTIWLCILNTFVKWGLYVDLVVCQIGVKYSEIYCFMSCNRKKGVNSIDCKKSTSFVCVYVFLPVKFSSVRQPRYVTHFILWIAILGIVIEGSSLWGEWDQ